MTPEQEQIRVLKKELKELTDNVLKYENAFEKIMKENESTTRGQKLGAVLNFLTIANQSAMHWGLGYSFKKIKQLYE